MTITLATLISISLEVPRERIHFMLCDHATQINDMKDNVELQEIKTLWMRVIHMCHCKTFYADRKASETKTVDEPLYDPLIFPSKRCRIPGCKYNMIHKIKSEHVHHSSFNCMLFPITSYNHSMHPFTQTGQKFLHVYFCDKCSELHLTTVYLWIYIYMTMFLHQ